MDIKQKLDNLRESIQILMPHVQDGKNWFFLLNINGK